MLTNPSKGKKENNPKAWPDHLHGPPLEAWFNSAQEI